jgi:hypothetical protein
LVEVSLWLLKVYPLVWNWLDAKMASNGCFGSDYANQLIQAYYFMGLLYLYWFINDLCFKAYLVFVIEEKYKYNKLTFGRFIKIEILKAVIDVVAYAALFAGLLAVMRACDDDHVVPILYSVVSAYILIYFFLYPVLLKPMTTEFS